MGGKTKTKTSSSTTPNPMFTPSIQSATAGLDNAFASAQGSVARYAPMQDQAIQRIQSNINNPPAYLSAARDNMTRTINGDFVNSNPELENMARRIGDQAQGGYAATFGASGRSHGGMAALLSAQGVGDALSTFRGNQYNFERGLQQQATMAAPAFHQDEYTDINALFPAIQSATNLPMGVANQYALGIGGLAQPYTNSRGTQTQSQGFGLAQAIALGAQVAQTAAAASDPRLKTNVVWVSTDEDGLDWFDFDYRQDMGLDLPKERQRGVMATDVAILRPWALGEPLGEYLTVDYSKLSLAMAA